MNEFVSWCRHLLVSFLFHALTSLNPSSFHRNDISTCILPGVMNDEKVGFICEKGNVGEERMLQKMISETVFGIADVALGNSSYNTRN